MYRMKKLKKNQLFLGIVLAVVFAQALVIANLISTKDAKTYEVNLVKINTEKDSIDYLRMRNDLAQIDFTVNELNRFLVSKNIPNERITALDKDSLSDAVYLAKQSNRYSQYLVDLQQKLQTIPLGHPTGGYISSNFGIRRNPIPSKTPHILMASMKPASKSEEIKKDSLGNPIPTQAKVADVKKAPAAEPDQMQFHKGIDYAVAYGSDIQCTAAGTVLFAGQKGGYGNCVIVSHGNGLATLYGHLSSILVKANETVKVGQVIAKSGNSGRSTGPHLHYEVHKNNTPVNPKLFLNL